MPVKRCAVCKKPAYTNTAVSRRDKQWLCASCLNRFEGMVAAGISQEQKVTKLCDKCRNKKTCRFPAHVRRKITACSDYENKQAEHNRRRWAKFETQD